MSVGVTPLVAGLVAGLVAIVIVLVSLVVALLSSVVAPISSVVALASLVVALVSSVVVSASVTSSGNRSLISYKNYIVMPDLPAVTAPMHTSTSIEMFLTISNVSSLKSIT